MRFSWDEEKDVLIEENMELILKTQNLLLMIRWRLVLLTMNIQLPMNVG